MTMLRKALALAGLVMVLFAGPAYAGDRLTSSDLKLLFPGDFQAVVKEAFTLRIVARSDGSLVGRFLGASDTGRWSIKSGKLCIMLNRWLKGRTNCSSVIEEAGWYKGADVKFRPI